MGAAGNWQFRQLQRLIAAVGYSEADGAGVGVRGNERDVFDDALAVEGV